LFGLSRAHGAEVTEQEWQRFLDEDVAPRLASGFTVVDGAGQWRDQAGALVRERSRVLIIVRPNTASVSALIDEVRAAYKRRFQQQSVLRIDDRPAVSF
jgi:hypothetical protein